MTNPDYRKNSVSLKEFAANHNDSLYDVVALLAAAAARIDEATPSHNEEPEASAAMHNTLRLVQLAHRKVQAIADDMLHQL